MQGVLANQRGRVRAVGGLKGSNNLIPGALPYGTPRHGRPPIASIYLAASRGLDGCDLCSCGSYTKLVTLLVLRGVHVRACALSISRDRVDVLYLTCTLKIDWRILRRGEDQL